MSLRLRWGVVILACIASVLVYFPVLDGKWVFDDVRLVATNDWLWRSYDGVAEELGQWWTVVSEPDERTDQVRVGFRPLRFFSYRLDALISMELGLERDDATAVFHLHNILLHGLCAALLYLLAFRIFRRGGHITSFAVAMAFLVHPVQTEAVAWISGRRDVLFTAAYLGALLLALGGGFRPGWGRVLLVTLLGAVSMAAKEMAATLPVVLLAVAWLDPKGPSDRNQWRSWGRVWIPVTLVILAMSIRILSIQDPGAGVSYWGGSPMMTLLTAGRALVSYLGLFLWPIGLCVDYSHAAFTASTGWLQPWTTLACWLVVGTGLFYSWRRVRQHEALAAIVVPLFIVLLSPVLQIFPHPERFAERFMYLPMVALLIPWAAMLCSIERRIPGARVSVIVVLGILMTLMTRDRLSDWEGPYPLWSSAVVEQPRCARAWFGLGEAARNRGWKTQAVDNLGQTVEILTDGPRDRLQQGMYLQSLQIRAGLLAEIGGQGNLILADQHLTHLLTLDDTDGTAVALQQTPLYESLKVKERLGDYEGARTRAQQLVLLDDVQDAVRLDATLYLAATSESDERDQYFEDARELANRISERAISRVEYQAGMVALEEKEFVQALARFDEALLHLDEAGRTSSARYRKAEAWLGLGKTTDARQVLNQLLESDPGHLPSHLSLGELLLGTDEIDAALEHFRLVLKAVPDNPQALQGIQQAAIRKKLKEGTAPAQVDTTRITALTMLADRMLGKGQPEKAREALVEAQKHAEGPAEKQRRIDLILRVARLDAEQGHWSLALVGYRDLLDRVEVGGREVFVLEAAEVFRRVEGPETALRMLRDQQELGVKESRLFRQMGAMAHQAGHFSEAARWYRKHLLENKDDDPQLRSRIEDALRKVEKSDRLEQEAEEESP
ncbi:MAG: tetratricopeptide repeat protein [Planctomycetota bacterium]|nr:tetratricopeptide repeat protein [Planctomycetota bacterium]